MKNANDLQKAGSELAKRFNGLTFEVKEKPYPESIIPWAKIVDSMWLLVNFKGCLFTSGRLNSEVENSIFDLHISDLSEELEYFDKYNEFKPSEELPF